MTARSSGIAAMHIADALIDEATGDAIVPGRIALTGARFSAELIGLFEHEMVLLDLGPGGLVCRPISRCERLDNGFCKVADGGPELQIAAITTTLVDALLRT